MADWQSCDRLARARKVSIPVRVLLPCYLCVALFCSYPTGLLGLYARNGSRVSIDVYRSLIEVKCLLTRSTMSVLVVMRLLKWNLFALTRKRYHPQLMRFVLFFPLQVLKCEYAVRGEIVTHAQVRPLCKAF